MRAISLPFRVDGYGRVASSSDMRRILGDRVRTVISTRPGERVMRPTFGCSMPDSLLNALDTVPEMVEDDISDAFLEWLPYAKFDRLAVNYEDERNGDIEVNVVYTLPTLTQNTDTSYSVII